MTKELSYKIRVISIIASILVVFRHSANLVAFFQEDSAPYWLCFIEKGVVYMTDIAVPYFFLISGFFFMRYAYIEEGRYWDMIKKKIKTLLIPFIIWNCIGSIALRLHSDSFAWGTSILSCIGNLAMSNWNGPLWFVRDLMILMATYPLYGFLYIKRGQPILLILLIIQMCYFWFPGEVHLLAGEGIFFFFLGGLFQKNSLLLGCKLPKFVCLIVFSLWLYLSFFITTWEPLNHRTSIVVGIIAFWFAIDLLPACIRGFCMQIAPYSFFIFVSHLYVLKAIKIGIASQFLGNGVVALLTFLFLPFVIISLIIFIGYFWKKKFPTIYKICVGGR